MIKYTTKFSLYNRVNADGTQPVRMRVSWAGNRLDHFLPISIESKYWDGVNMRVKNTYRPQGDLSASAALNTIIIEARDLVDKFFNHCDVNGVESATYNLKDWLDPQKAQLRTPPKLRLFVEVGKAFLEDSIATGCWSNEMIVHVEHVIKDLDKYQPEAKLGEVDDVFIRGFIEFLFDKGNRNTTVRKKVQQVKWILKWSQQKGYYVNPKALHFEQKFKGVSDSSREVIYLTWDEMMKLRDYPFDHYRKLAETRDVFLFCCFSGLRYSDVSTLRKSDISDGRIRVITQKTSKALDIELNQYTNEILSKYKDRNLGGMALPVPALHSYNNNLKNAARQAGIDTPTRKVHFVKSERIETIRPKYEIITSHCARRSFVVNALRLGIPAEVIMSWTGHSDYDAMRPYVKIADDLKTASMAKFDGEKVQSQISAYDPEVCTIKKGRPKKPIVEVWEREILDDQGIKQLHKSQMIEIMREVSKGGMLFQVDLVERMGVSIDTIRRRMKYLLENDYLSCSGWGRATRWRIKQKLLQEKEGALTR